MIVHGLRYWFYMYHSTSLTQHVHIHRVLGILSTMNCGSPYRYLFNFGRSVLKNFLAPAQNCTQSLNYPDTFSELKRNSISNITTNTCMSKQTRMVTGYILLWLHNVPPKQFYVFTNSQCAALHFPSPLHDRSNCLALETPNRFPYVCSVSWLRGAKSRANQKDPKCSVPSTTSTGPTTGRSVSSRTTSSAITRRTVWRSFCCEKCQLRFPSESQEFAHVLL